MGKSHDELRGSGEAPCKREVAENNEPSLSCFLFCLQGARALGSDDNLTTLLIKITTDDA